MCEVDTRDPSGGKFLLINVKAFYLCLECYRLVDNALAYIGSKRRHFLLSDTYLDSCFFLLWVAHLLSGYHSSQVSDFESQLVQPVYSLCRLHVPVMVLWVSTTNKSHFVSSFFFKCLSSLWCYLWVAFIFCCAQTELFNESQTLHNFFLSFFLILKLKGKQIEKPNMRTFFRTFKAELHQKSILDTSI